MLPTAANRRLKKANLAAAQAFAWRRQQPSVSPHLCHFSGTSRASRRTKIDD